MRPSAELHLVRLGYNDLGYNELGYNEFGYNELGYNELGFNELGFNELNVSQKNNFTTYINRFITDKFNYSSYQIYKVLRSVKE